MSAFGGKASSLFALQMSAYDPERTSASFPMLYPKLASSQFEKWSILNRPRCQMGSGLHNWALFLPRA